MTTQEFIHAMEAYYGLKYDIEIEIKMIGQYLSTKSPDDIDKFFQAVISHHSKNFRSLPDIAIFRIVEEKRTDKELEFSAELAWREIMPVSPLHDVLIVDPAAHFVVSGYGSWAAFCQSRDGQYRNLIHREFIDKYVAAARAGVNIRPVQLPGHYSVEYGAGFVGAETLRIIGDETQGRVLLAIDGNDNTKQLTEFVRRV